MDEHRRIEMIANDGFMRRTEIIAPLERFSRIVQQLDRFRVANARKRFFDCFQFGDIPLQQLQFVPAAFEHPLDHKYHHVFLKTHVVVHVKKSRFRLDHPKLQQVAAGLGFLRPERWTKTVDPAKRGCRRLVVKLATLGKIGFFAMVVDFEQIGGPFAGRRRDDRRIRQHKIIAVKKLAQCKFDFGSDAQNGRLLGGANPKMPPLRQKVHPMFLEADRVFLRQTNDFQAGDIEFIAASSPGFGAHSAP